MLVLVQKLLHLCEEYHLCDDGDLHHPKLSCEMTILVCEYCGVDLGAAKRSKSLLKKFLPCCLPSPDTESPSKCHHLSSLVSSVEVVNTSSECGESEVAGSPAPLFPLHELCASLSTIQAEVSNLHISINNFTACLASELKDLHATVETGFVCSHFLG